MGVPGLGGVKALGRRAISTTVEVGVAAAEVVGMAVSVTRLVSARTLRRLRPWGQEPAPLRLVEEDTGDQAPGQ